jgi:hypothetical protein
MKTVLICGWEEAMNFWILWAVVGWGFSAAFLMHFWLPDPPPPEVFGRFAKASIAGIVGGVLGGAVSRALFSSDPMPSLTGSNPMPGIVAVTLIGAAAVGVVIAGGVLAATGGGQRAR